MTEPIPKRHAVAMAYDAHDVAPKIVAKGNDLVAEKIIALAKEHGVPVHESKELVNLLMRVDLDSHIPVELYVAVAELLVWLHRVDGTQTNSQRVS